jgi:hypothetical protein
MTAAEMMSQMEDDTQVVGIDEGQFFDMAVIEAVNELANSGKRVIVAGLDPGLSRQTVRADAAIAFNRRIYHENARHLRQMRKHGELFPENFRINRAGRKSARAINTKRAAANVSCRIPTRRRLFDYYIKVRRSRK